MSYTVNFMDNGPVTAELLNNTAAELGGGVLAFEDEQAYGVDHLNDISASLITKGVSRGCSLSIADEQVTVGEGVLYMSDGRRIEIDADGVSMNFVSGSRNYVWFGYDAVTGFVSPRCTVEEPAADDVVMVGYITEELALEEKPDRAVMKNPFLGLHSTESHTKSFKWNNNDDEELLWEIEISDIGYRYAVVHSTGYQSGDNTINAFCGFLDLSTRAAFSVLNYFVYNDRGMDSMPYSSDNGEMLVACALCEEGTSNFHFVYLRFDLGTDNILRVYQRAEDRKWSGMMKTKGTEITITFC